MKRILVLIMFLATATGYGQGWWLGIRAGDPTGITIKKYIDENAIEINVGGADLLYGKKLYTRDINNAFLSQSVKNINFTTTINTATKPKGFQIHYMHRKVLSLTSSALQAYYGVGGQFRVQRASYTFGYKIPNDPTWHYLTGAKVTDVDLGVDGVAGLEYLPDNASIAFFFDISVFLEGADDPFILSLQGGLGLRYHFGSNSAAVKPL